MLLLITLLKIILFFKCFYVFNEANYRKLQKTLHFMFVFKYQKGTLLQKCCFFFIIPFLYLEIKIMHVKNFRRKSDISSLSPTSPRVYVLQKMLANVYRYLWVFIQSFMVSEIYLHCGIRK